MHKPITFEPEVEKLATFIEETPRASIIEETLAKLRQGVPQKALLTAGALAVTRSTDLPSHHHGGPIHPVAGTYPVYQTAKILSGEKAFLPIIQHVALCNKHIHDPETGPAIMADMEPLSAPEGTVEATKEAFLSRVQRRHAPYAEHHLLWLLEHMKPDEVLDLALNRAIPRNAEDDHFFLYLTFAARTLDCIGWEWAPVIMRPPVKYLCRLPYSSIVMGPPPSIEPIEELMEEYKLAERDLTFHTSAGETEAIGELAERIGTTDKYAPIPEMLAKAMVDGLSIEGTAEALSVGAATIFLRTAYGNPMDVHLHTGINIRRYLLRLPGVSLRNKILSLLTWHSGPEIRLSENKMHWSARTSAETMAALPKRSQDGLLDAITESIETQPSVDWDVIGTRLDLMEAAPEVKDTIALGQGYADAGYDPMALFVRLAEIGSRDDFSEMHFFKFTQAVMEEFYTTREQFRNVHLVAAAKAGAVIYGKRQDVYAHTQELLRV